MLYRALIFLAFTLNAFGATTYYVVSTAAGGGSGTQASPFNTIQAGVNAASAGDTVLVTQGTYSELVSSAANGSAGSLIVIKANPTNNAPTLVNGFRLKNRFNWISGFSAVKTVSDNANAAWVYIDPPGASN